LNISFLLVENDPNETFSVEYAKSNRSRYHGCDSNIDKDNLRLSRKNFTSRRARKYGPQDQWYHVDCFEKMKKDLGFYGNAQSFVVILLLFHFLIFKLRFSGIVDLNNEDKKELEEKFGSSTNSKRKRKGEQINDQSTKAKQAKIEDSDEQEETHRKKVLF
jgi:hypothetical protein